MQPHPSHRGAHASTAVTRLLDELESETRRLTHLHDKLAECRSLRVRLAEGVRAVLPTLPAGDAQAAFDRLRGLERSGDVSRRRAARRDQQAVLTLLASWPHATIAVADVQERLSERGLEPRRTYAAGALAHLAKQGMCARTARGRYRIDKTHPELVALRLAALEAELRA